MQCCSAGAVSQDSSSAVWLTADSFTPTGSSEETDMLYFDSALQCRFERPVPFCAWMCLCVSICVCVFVCVCVPTEHLCVESGYRSGLSCSSRTRAAKLYLGQVAGHGGKVVQPLQRAAR